MTRGEIYRTAERVPERGNKPGFYIIVSRAFVAENDDISTVICAPVYSEVLGIATEVIVGQTEGLPRKSAARCDFLALLFKRKLSGFVGTLSPAKAEELDLALRVALGIGVT